MFWRVVLLALGAGVVWKGATWVVNGSTKMARFFAFPRIMLGFTIIAIGTSLPELGVGIFSALGGDTALSLGNIIGAGFLNLCVVLGLAAIISPVSINRSTLFGEAPFLFLAVGLLWVLGIDGVIDRLDGILLLVAYCAFFALIGIQLGTQHVHPHILNRIHEFQVTGKTHSVIRTLCMIIGGMVALVIGARLIVDSGIALAQWWGVPSLVIGLTLVSLGTVVPEMVTAIVSSRRHANDLNIGNVFGGVVFNTLCIIGIVGVIYPISIDSTLLTRDIPLLLVVSFGVIALLKSGSRLVRWEGFLLIAVYVLYLVAMLVATPAVHV
ncbi:MAG TPA: calcium/sodium antiporter [Patescibacteria group bacterium]|nr:calcium/sodium antiporter [Patescibacteria group bacterium]